MIVLELGLSLAVGFVVSIVILIAFGYDPLRCITIMFSYGFRDVYYLLSRATPLIATGIAFAIPLLAGLFNIGSEGQLYIGALTTIVVAHYLGNGILALIAGICAGAAVAGLIAILKVYRDINEVVSSIMFNWTLFYLILFLITNYLYDPTIPHQSVSVPKSVQLGIITIGNIRITIAFIIAVLGAIIAYLIVYRSGIGYAIRVTGYSDKTALYAGIDPRKTKILALVLGGAFAGFGGALQALGIVPYIDTTMSTLFGLGFTGIGVALLGRSNPIGIVFAALFVSGLFIGGQMMELKTNVPPELADVIIGIVIIALALPYAYRTIVYWIKTRAKVRRL
ncbi:MAG TPA: ABC transporter permease [Desulfurococcaceae archaeon]|nr:ABC transporter permease [Desulfurococcaceae archaeon]